MNKYDEIIKLADSYIGYTESPRNSNRTIFGEWYGMNGVSWCMEFVQYVHNKIGKPLPYKTASCSELLNWYKKHKPEAIKTEPKKGYIIIYNFGHTGIFKGYNSDGKIIAIEGNTSPTEIGSQSNGGGVYERLRSKSKVTAYIDGICEEEKEDEDIMTGEEIYKALIEYLATLPESSWSQKEGAFARISKKIGKNGKTIMDGKNPRCFITREQLAAILDRNER